jgi:hypothetical protein
MADNVRARVRELLRERGATAAARDLRMPRETLLAVGADAPVRDGTLALARERLDKMEAR